VRVSEEKVLRWIRAAEEAERSLSDWIRRSLDRAASGVAERVDARPLPEDEQSSDKGRVEKVSRQVPRERTSPVAGANPVPTTKKVAMACPHGTEKGWNCWKCGGLAKVTE